MPAVTAVALWPVRKKSATGSVAGSVAGSGRPRDRFGGRFGFGDRFKIEPLQSEPVVALPQLKRLSAYTASCALHARIMERWSARGIRGIATSGPAPARPIQTEGRARTRLKYREVYVYVSCLRHFATARHGAHLMHTHFGS